MQDPGTAALAHSPSERPGGSTRAARKEIVVFTCDDEFLLSLGPAMDDRYRSRPTDGSGDWAGMLRGRRGVALIDAATLTNAPEIVRVIEAQFREFAIVVFAPAAARAQWSLALSRGSIARLLAREELGNESIASALETEPRTDSAATTDSTRGASDGGAPERRKRWLLMGGAACAALAIGAAAWMWRSGSQPPATTAAPSRATTAPATVAPAPVAASDERAVPELLSAARVAFGERRYLEPAGNNALELYLRVLAGDAANAEAVDGLHRVVTIAAGQAAAEIKAGQFDDAAKLYDLLRAAVPADPAVAALGADISAARPKWLAARARDAIANDQFGAAERSIEDLAAAGADKAVLQDLRRSLDAHRKDADLARALADARASLGAGSLLDASAAGPRAHLAALQQIDRRSAQVVAFQREYQAALARSASDATRSGDFASADKLLAAAADLGASRDVSDARKELQSARESAAAREQQRADAARQRAGSEAAPAARAAAPPRMPKATRRAPPKYPADAERKGIEGYAIIEFGLTADGHTRDLRVAESSPEGVFDDAALAAVRSWRFEPISADDAARLPHASVRLAFRLGDRQ
ncbi:MAG: hypothetical protein CMLOHMNK_00095 [Steroidobacteraceae bacterium]|nr:hypothetical protein [Steroidobacteraceae bacterium]